MNKINIWGPNRKSHSPIVVDGRTENSFQHAHELRICQNGCDNCHILKISTYSRRLLLSTFSRVRNKWVIKWVYLFHEHFFQTTLRCQINESTRLSFLDFFPSFFHPTWLAFLYFFTTLYALFPPYLISKFSTLLVYEIFSK